MTKRLRFLDKQSLTYPVQPLPHTPTHPLSLTSHSPVYKGIIQGALFLAIEITNAYDFAIQISTALYFVMLALCAYAVIIMPPNQPMEERGMGCKNRRKYFN